MAEKRSRRQELVQIMGTQVEKVPISGLLGKTGGPLKTGDGNT